MSSIRTLLHIIERAHERYGITVSVDEVIHMRNCIVAGKSVLVERQDESETHIVMTPSGRAMKAVFVAPKQIIVTVLPRNAKCHRRKRVRHDQTP